MRCLHTLFCSFLPSGEFQEENHTSRSRPCIPAGIRVSPTVEEESIFHQKILAAVGTTGVCRKVWLSVLLCARLKRVKIKSIQIQQKDPNPAGLGLPLHSIYIHTYTCIFLYILYIYVYTHTDSDIYLIWAWGIWRSVTSWDLFCRSVTPPGILEVGDFFWGFGFRDIPCDFGGLGFPLAF